ncbi:hypothetical protein QBC34DRAFT_65872 [Podospora aff. communis PSN243]|uniref:Uncharacterized protein n=1 Tax=Podospora aff. communis PSN243 TaxID=3040156 RepID=A0AAV9GS02_9PEZI|nr:hypothetical protein QBC34DRAFT_65872 [Podospora aff. communis PSN243]
MSAPTPSTPLLQANTLPLHSGYAQAQDHKPIFLRVCHSPWSFISQSALVHIRATIVLYLSVLAVMLSHYKNKFELHVLDEGKGEDGEWNPWKILFQFSTFAFSLLWLYHVIAFCWTFTHLYYPDPDENDDRWEYRLLQKMSPPRQTPYSRKRFFFSLFYSVVHVVAFMNAFIYWTVLVPKGHGHFPKGDGEGGNKGGDKGEEHLTSSTDEFFGHGWFQPFCLINLWCVTALLAFIEIIYLNSVKRQVPVLSHVFSIIAVLLCYLGWASFGHWLTGEYPFFWMDREVMGYTETVAAYSVGFLGLGPTFFILMYGLIGMRETVTKKAGPVQPQRFDPAQFTQDVADQVAQDVREGFQRTAEQQQY